MAAQYPTSAADDSNLYIAVNNTSTTLTDNPLAAGAVTVNVNDASAFPSTGTITIDAEIIKYTGKTATSFTGCTRGFDGTSDVAHTVNTPVYHRIIADHHNTIKEEIKAIETDLIAIKAALNDVDTPASTASDVKDRLDQIVSQLKLITGETNWYDVPDSSITSLYSSVNAKLPLSGGTMTGNIAMSGSQKLTGLAAGSTNGDSVRYDEFNSLSTEVNDVESALNDSTTAGSTATSLTNRINQIVTQLKAITGQANWYTSIPNRMGKVLQVIQVTDTTSTNITTATWTDTGLSASITPTTTSSKILVMVKHRMLSLYNNSRTDGDVRIDRSGTVIATFGTVIGGKTTSGGSSETTAEIAVEYLDSPATTSSRTYKTQAQNVSASGTIQINGSTGVSSITLIEIGV